MKRITNKTAMEKLKSIPNNTPFFVKFIKRSTGEIRGMNCAKGVASFVGGDGAAYDAKEHNLITVFDYDVAAEIVDEFKIPFSKILDEENKPFLARAYRSINLESIMEIRWDEHHWFVNEFPVKDFKISWPTDHAVVQARTEKEACATFKREAGVKRMPANYTVEAR